MCDFPETGLSALYMVQHVVGDDAVISFLLQFQAVRVADSVFYFYLFFI